MQLLQRVRYSEVQWGPLLAALTLTGFGIAFVASATADPTEGFVWGREARMQVVWLCLALSTCLVAMHVPLQTWRSLAIPAFIGMLFVQAFMIALSGTALVPTIKGAHNWIAVGPLRVQPSEFYKLAALLLTARLLTNPETDIRRLHWCVAVGFVGCLPAVLIAKEDLGSGMTFLPMVLGMLFFAGMPTRYLVLFIGLMSSAVAIGLAMLPENTYHMKRLRAWVDPESYALTEGFQTLRSLRSLGSGQWTGKGYGVGDQNLLGWLPEKHTDMIFAVIGEETGFLGCAFMLLLILAFGLLGLYAGMRCRQPFGRCLVVGFTCLIMGQVTINLLVVTGLMPVTGITLPFFSYGGSSLLGTYTGLGICLAASVARNKQLGGQRYRL